MYASACNIIPFLSIYLFLFLQPHVDFGLKLVGADLMSIPGLYRVIQVRCLYTFFCCFVHSASWQIKFFKINYIAS